MTATELPRTKTGLREIGLHTLIIAASAFSIPGAVEMKKSDLIDAILKEQAREPVQAETQEAEKVLETDEQRDADIQPTIQDAQEEAPSMTEDEHAAALEEVKMAAAATTAADMIEIPPTPSSLSVLPTWLYFVASSPEPTASSNMKRAFGRACDFAGIYATEKGYKAFSAQLREAGRANIVGAVKSVYVYRARAI